MEGNKSLYFIAFHSHIASNALFQSNLILNCVCVCWITKANWEQGYEEIQITDGDFGDRP